MNAEDFSKALATVDGCISQYITGRKTQIEPFVANHFSLQQAIALQKKSALVDLLFYPLNALWSIPYLSLKKSIETLDKLGWMKFNHALEVIPSGFKTRYQKETERLLTEDFLAPQTLIDTLKKKSALGSLLSPPEFSRLEQQITAEFTKEINKYTSSQILISDLASSVASIFVGRFFFGDGNLDIFSLGNRIARKMAKDRAVDNFFLGKNLGSVFYKVVPVEPSKTQVFLTTLGVGLLLTGFSLLAAVLSDPLRKKLGLHNKKLNALLLSLEERLFLLIKNELKQSRKERAS